MYGYSFMPFFFGISISNECNRKCDFCLYQSVNLKRSDLLTWLDGQPKRMSFDRFDKFISGLGIMKYFIKNVGLTAKGEPMKHPDFFRFCDTLEKAKIRFSITTNGDYLNKSEIDRFSYYKYLTLVRVSVYEIKTYNRLKDVPFIKFYNMTNDNIKGTIKGLRLWADGLTTNTIPKNFNEIDYCRKPFVYLTINPDGSITPCNSWYEIGNVFITSLLNIWNNKKIRNYRKGALRMNVPESDCKNCGFNIN